jgi:hypothetical protein
MMHVRPARTPFRGASIRLRAPPARRDDARGGRDERLVQSDHRPVSRDTSVGGRDNREIARDSRMGGRDRPSVACDKRAVKRDK